MFGWLRRGPARLDTAVAMIGVRAHDDVLFLGAGDPSLAAETGTITRLNGRTVVAGRGADAEARIEQAAAKTGAIVEFVDTPAATLPFADGAFQIVVLAHLAAGTPDGTATLSEAVRVLRPGGRIILVFGEPARGLLGQLNVPPPPATDVIVIQLQRAGLVAARRLAQAEGVTYFEARKARD